MSSLAMLVGMGAFFAALIASRHMKHRAFTTLSDEQKLLVLDAFGGMRAVQMIPIAVLVLLYLGVSMMSGGSSALVLTVFWLGLLVYGVLSVALQLARLRQLDLPESYTRSWLLGRAMVFGSMALMMLGLWFGGLR